MPCQTHSLRAHYERVIVNEARVYKQSFRERKLLQHMNTLFLNFFFFTPPNWEAKNKIRPRQLEKRRA